MKFTGISLAYNFGELEADYKKLLKKGWLKDDDLEIVTKEVEEIKDLYKKLSDNFNQGEAELLNNRIKSIPIGTFLKNKEKFLAKFYDWEKGLSES
jgi:hypothetical protein